MPYCGNYMEDEIQESAKALKTSSGSLDHLYLSQYWKDGMQLLKKVMKWRIWEVDRKGKGYWFLSAEPAGRVWEAALHEWAMEAKEEEQQERKSRAWRRVQTRWCVISEKHPEKREKHPEKREKHTSRRGVANRCKGKRGVANKRIGSETKTVQLSTDPPQSTLNTIESNVEHDHSQLNRCQGGNPRRRSDLLLLQASLFVPASWWIVRNGRQSESACYDVCALCVPGAWPIQTTTRKWSCFARWYTSQTVKKWATGRNQDSW